MARTGISQRLRFDILHRDQFRCHYCGAAAPNVELHIDHIIPVKDGGKNTFANMVAACVSCNLGKGAVNIDTETARVNLDIARSIGEAISEHIVKGPDDRIGRWFLVLSALEDILIANENIRNMEDVRVEVNRICKWLRERIDNDITPELRSKAVSIFPEDADETSFWASYWLFQIAAYRGVRFTGWLDETHSH